MTSLSTLPHYYHLQTALRPLSLPPFAPLSQASFQTSPPATTLLVPSTPRLHDPAESPYRTPMRTRAPGEPIHTQIHITAPVVHTYPFPVAIRPFVDFLISHVALPVRLYTPPPSPSSKRPVAPTTPPAPPRTPPRPS